VTHPNAALVEEFHRRQAEMYAGGPIEPVAELLADDVVWHVPGKSPIAGDHRGRGAVLRYFTLRRRLANETFTMRMREQLVDDEAVVQLVDGHAVLDGREATWRTVGLYRIRDNRIAEAWLVPFDLDRFDELWTPG
jgi:ketosteroid isomerase-like protein